MNETEEKAMQLLDAGYHRDDVANATGLPIERIIEIEEILESDAYDPEWDGYPYSDDEADFMGVWE